MSSAVKAQIDLVGPASGGGRLGDRMTSAMKPVESKNKDGWKPQTAWRAREWEQSMAGDTREVKKGKEHVSQV